jgi:hypothetical protein
VLLGAARPLPAELNASVRLSALASLANSGGTASLFGLGRSILDLRAAGNRNVQGVLQLESFLSRGVYLYIPRAYVQVRLPGFRLMIGKHRVSWGEGFYFNAGDVIFGSLSPTLQGLGTGTARDQTDWLLEAYLPLGQFSYLEGVVLPYLGEGVESGFALRPVAGLGLTEDLERLLDPVRLERLTAGGRAVTRLGDTKLEAGYLYHGRSFTHRPYVSLQGHLLVNWHLSASLAVPARDPAWRETADSLAVSAGLYHIASLPFADSISLRLEAGIRPAGAWQAADLGADSAGYGLLLFPEIVAAASPTVSLELRSVVSPVDASAFLQGGASWNVYQGLTLFGYLTAMAGEGGDLFAWNRDGSQSLNLGLEYIY